MPSIIEDKVITDPKLREVFEKYALHGNRTSLMTTPASTPMKKTETQLDGMRFAKLIREANLLDNKLISSVDVDIIFAKVKPKTERKIKFDDFVKAVKLIGEKKFGPDGFELAQNAIIRIGYPCLSPGKKVGSIRLRRLMYFRLHNK